MPLFYNYGDLSNTSVRVFLYHAGLAYDQRLGNQPLKSKGNVNLHKVQALSFQRECCFYCNTPFSDANKPERDHVIPMKKETGGMHCWGNVLYCCRTCNVDKDKFAGDWKEFLISKSKMEDYKIWSEKYGNDEELSNIHAEECKQIYSELDTYMRNKVRDLL
ncbi:HNH endonuclease domain protein [Bacteriovorax sp. BSW11_IV]|nr:HNH endonuclease domain protein [Bacteriovorax sp. BSW11_IV]